MDLVKLSDMLSLQSRLDDIMKKRAIELGYPKCCSLIFKNKGLYTELLLYEYEFGSNSILSDVLCFKRNRVLDRLVNCWSSALSVALHYFSKDDIVIKVGNTSSISSNNSDYIFNKIVELTKDTFGLIDFIGDIEERSTRYLKELERNACQTIVELSRLLEVLGFTFDEMYQRYIYLQTLNLDRLSKLK